MFKNTYSLVTALKKENNEFEYQECTKNTSPKFASMNRILSSYIIGSAFANILCNVFISAMRIENFAFI